MGGGDLLGGGTIAGGSTCVQPPNNSQCGIGGAACRACLPGQVCTNGACTPIGLCCTKGAADSCTQAVAKDACATGAWFPITAFDAQTMCLAAKGKDCAVSPTAPLGFCCKAQQHLCDPAGLVTNEQCTGPGQGGTNLYVAKKNSDGTYDAADNTCKTTAVEDGKSLCERGGDAKALINLCSSCKAKCPWWELGCEKGTNQGQSPCEETPVWWDPFDWFGRRYCSAGLQCP